MNDLGNTNKMVSDTPRTEAEVARLKGPTDDIVTVDANFACELERELNAANARIKRLKEAGDLLSRMVCRQDGYGIYQDEEDAVNWWNEAKEDKL